MGMYRVYIYTTDLAITFTEFNDDFFAKDFPLKKKSIRSSNKMAVCAPDGFSNVKYAEVYRKTMDLGGTSI